MSNIYIQEPPSNGKVLLSTTLGDIDIELWSKEAPKACRNFVQLCMEGYYDNTIFHRVEKGFVAQGGDPTGTGTGGKSIYGKPFKDEFHQRLRFNRRGLVAMANAGTDDNGSQFFFTLGAAEELTKKHTIFGKVTGNTLYNMIRFNDIDVDEDFRPFSPPKITKTQVLSNPFEDIEPRKLKSADQNKDVKDKKVKSKSKATKNYKLLSFGEEAEDDEVETDQATKDLQIKSSHDLLNDPKLSSLPAVVGTRVADESKLPVQKKKKKNKEVKKPSDDKDDESDEEHEDKKESKGKDSTEQEAPTKSQKGDEIPEKKAKEEPVNELLVELVNVREKFRHKHKHKRQQQKSDAILKKGVGSEDQTLALLASFQSKVDSVLTSGTTGEDASDSKSDSWMAHKMKCAEESEDAKDANVKGDDWYDIYDPRNPVNERKRKKSTKDGKQSVK